jgi:hypothetical protein
MSLLFACLLGHSTVVIVSCTISQSLGDCFVYRPNLAALLNCLFRWRSVVGAHKGVNGRLWGGEIQGADASSVEFKHIVPAAG